MSLTEIMKLVKRIATRNNYPHRARSQRPSGQKSESGRSILWQSQSGLKVVTV